MDLFNLSNTNTLAHFETGEVNIFDNRTDVSFTRSGSSNINKNLLIADYDQDLDGGDIILTFNNFGANYVDDEMIVIDQARVGNITELENLENLDVLGIFKVMELVEIGYGKVKPSDPGYGAFSVAYSDVTVQSINSVNGFITLFKEFTPKAIFA